MRILIVDNSIQIIDSLSEILSDVKTPTIIYKAVNYNEAIAYFISEKPQVVLLDAGLPCNQSIELLKLIKAIDKNTTVIILSIHIDDQIKDECFSFGTDFFFDKYYDFEQIPLVINTRYAQKTSDC